MLEKVIEKEIKTLSVNKTNRHCLMCGADFHFDKFWDRGNNWRPDNNLCRNCQFWFDKIEMRDDKNVARIDGEHYIIGEPKSSIKGFGGKKFTIMFNNNRIVKTDNLWHQGRIPIVWRKYLPNNAIFVTNKLRRMK